MKMCIVLGFLGVFAVSLGYEPPRYLTVTSKGELMKRIDISGKKAGECYLTLTWKRLYVPWNGEDSLDYAIQDSLLFLNGRLVGIYGEIDLSKIANPEHLYYLTGRLKNYSFLSACKNLIYIGSTFSSDTCLTYFQGLNKLRILDLYWNSITDKGMASIKNLPLLQSLDISDALITDTGLAVLEEMNQLKRLNLSGTKITDSGLDVLCRLDKLEELDLDRTYINDEGLSNISCCSKLKYLEISNNDNKSGFTGAGLANLTKLAGLETLSVSGSNKIGDMEFSALCDITSLIRLDIYGYDSINDAGFKNVSRLKKIQELTIGYGNKGRITDESLGALSELKDLRRLTISGAYFSDEGLKMLRQALPDCRTYFTNPDSDDDVIRINPNTSVNTKDSYIFKQSINFYEW